MRRASFSRLSWIVAVVWISAVVNAAVAGVNRQWFAIVPSLTACVASAGWYMAVRQWAAWRALALKLARDLGIEES